MRLYYMIGAFLTWDRSIFTFGGIRARRPRPCLRGFEDPGEPLKAGAHGLPVGDVLGNALPR